MVPCDRGGRVGPSDAPTPEDSEPTPLVGLGMAATGEFTALEQDEARTLILRGLEEDCPDGDVTSELLLPEDRTIRAGFVPRDNGVVCGIPVVAALFREIEPAISLRPLRSDGDRIHSGEAFMEIEGPIQPILRGERLALNFLQRLSGVSTLTRRFVDAVAGTHCHIYDTRKTTPGWRALEKYAVRAAGGKNHRRGLSDMVLIKDNHRKVLASLGDADLTGWLQRIRQVRSELAVEIEVDSVDELNAALEAGYELILLDNFSLEDLGRAVTLTRRRPGKTPVLEASGGVRLESVREVAETGVDRIAVGAITHSAVALDIGLDVGEVLA